jgi:hypothetical protein
MSGLIIESATLKGIYWNSATFVHFLESQKQLKKLHLNSVSTGIFEKKYLVRINFDGLEELFVEGIEFEEPKDLQNFCGFLKKLRSLRILKLYITIDLALLKVILNELPILKSVDFGPARIQPIPEPNNLRKNFEIEYFAVASFSAEVFPAIKTLLPLLPSLRNINVSECPIELLPDVLRDLSKYISTLDSILINGKQMKSTKNRMERMLILSLLFLYTADISLNVALLLLESSYIT